MSGIQSHSGLSTGFRASHSQSEPWSELLDLGKKAFILPVLEIEVYQDTLHGWCPADSAVYDETQAERAWSRLLALFDRSLV